MRKRQKFFLRKYYKFTSKQKEIHYKALNFLKKTKFCPPLHFGCSILLTSSHLHLSKLKTYCLVTGRVRYTIKDVQVSRHTFFELCRDGFYTGFFQK